MSPLNGGVTCGPTRTVEPCPVDCVLGEWSMWSVCDLDLDTYVRTKTRSISPLNRGVTRGPRKTIDPCTYISETISPDQNLIYNFDPSLFYF